MSLQLAISAPSNSTASITLLPEKTKDDRITATPRLQHAVGVVLLRVRVGRGLLLAAAQMYAIFLSFGELWVRKTTPTWGKVVLFFLQAD